MGSSSSRKLTPKYVSFSPKYVSFSSNRNKTLTTKGKPSEVRSVSFSPDGQWIASGSEDKTVKIWSVESGECVTTFNGHSLSVSSVSFSPDGASIVSGSHDNTVKVWSVESGECVTLNGHSYGVLSVSFSPDGKHVASGSFDKTVKVWKRTTVTVVDPVIELPCKHSFHKSCICNWLTRNVQQNVPTKCPLCRKDTDIGICG